MKVKTLAYKKFTEVFLLCNSGNSLLNNNISYYFCLNNHLFHEKANNNFRL